MMHKQQDHRLSTEEGAPEDNARREFMKKAGRFAVVTPPTIAVLLGTTLNSRAIAASTGTTPGNTPGGPTNRGGGGGDGGGFLQILRQLLGID